MSIVRFIRAVFTRFFTHKHKPASAYASAEQTLVTNVIIVPKEKFVAPALASKSRPQEHPVVLVNNKKVLFLSRRGEFRSAKIVGIEGNFVHIRRPNGQDVFTRPMALS